MDYSTLALGLDFGVWITIATPPRIATEAITNLNPIGSPSENTAIKAVMTGTLSCTVAALVTVKPFKAAYHIAYPHPDARAPDKTANTIPAASM